MCMEKLKRENVYASSLRLILLLIREVRDIIFVAYDMSSKEKQAQELFLRIDGRRH